MTPRVELADDLHGRLRARAIWAGDAQYREDRVAYDAMETLALALRERYAGMTAGQIEDVGDARRLYREFGIDPTKTRPSSEALLRRALRGKPLYNINNIVDTGNYVSLHSLLPLGLYDRDSIEGDLVEIRTGREGEGYGGIRKGRVNVAERLCVADSVGAFGSPTSDSQRTSVRDSTSRLLVILFAPFDAPPARLQSAAKGLVDCLLRWTDAKVTAQQELG